MPRTLCFLSRRRLLGGSLAVGLTTLLGACGSSPPVRLYVLSSLPPVPPPAAPGAGAAAPAVTATPETWQLLQPLRIPEYLDREALLLPEGGSGLLVSSGHRWAESLRDAVPRVLLQDLRTLRGDGQVWSSPVPPGLAVARQLRVELTGFEAEPDQRAVRLLARWTWLDPRGQAAPQSHAVQLREANAGGGIDGLVAAHRLALWRLAERISASR